MTYDLAHEWGAPHIDELRQSLSPEELDGWIAWMCLRSEERSKDVVERWHIDQKQEWHRTSIVACVIWNQIEDLKRMWAEKYRPQYRKPSDFMPGDKKKSHRLTGQAMVEAIRRRYGHG